MKVNTKSIVMSLALVLIGNQARSENETAATEISVLNQRIGMQNRLSDEMIDETSRKLTTILPQIHFEPDYGPQRDSDAPNPNGATAIKEITRATLAILGSEKVKSLGAKDNQSPSLKAVDEVMAKLDAAMDPNWKHLPVSISVMPPAVTPNASAGMNPDAIADPQLRKQYLDLINLNRYNNLKNGQQRALRVAKAEIVRTLSTLIQQAPENGWRQTDVAERFCKDEESKRQLSKQLED
jgi:hypothetical protein